MVVHMNTPTEALGGVVARALGIANLSEREAAHRTNIPRSTLKRKLVTGDFTVTELASIARVLKVNVSDLIQWAETAA